MIKEYQCIINVDPVPTHRSSSHFISGSDETQVGYSPLCPIRIHLKWRKEPILGVKPCDFKTQGIGSYKHTRTTHTW